MDTTLTKYFLSLDKKFIEAAWIRHNDPESVDSVWFTSSCVNIKFFFKNIWSPKEVGKILFLSIEILVAIPIIIVILVAVPILIEIVVAVPIHIAIF